MLVVGIGTFGGALLSYVFGPNFTYSVYEASPGFAEDTSEYEDTNVGLKDCYSGKAIEIDGKGYCFDDQERQKDLINGGVLSITMLLFFFIHRVAAYVSYRKNEDSLFKKLYTFAPLFLYGLLSIIALPIAIYDVLNYLVIERTEISTYNWPHPGYSIAVAAIVVPIWLVYLAFTVRMRNEGE